MKRQKIKSWLEENKIYFEIFVAAALAVASFIVSWFSYQNSKYQTLISETELRPIFFPQISQEFYVWPVGFVPSDSNEHTKTRVINVINKGGVYYNLDRAAASYLELYLTVPGKNQVATSVPVLYFDYSYVPDEEGVVFKFAGYKNLDEEARIYAEFLNILEKKGYTGYLTFKHFLKLGYQDVFEKNQTQYFSFPHSLGGQIIDKNTGELIFKTFTKENPKTLGDITPKFLLNLTEVME